jgi:hypothetical protein
MADRHYLITLFTAILLTACNASEAVVDKTSVPVTSAPATAAALPDAAQLVKKLATQGGCQDSTAEIRLTSVAEDGKKEQVEFRLQRKYTADKVQTLLAVLAPREETEKALLATEPVSQPTEAVSYLAGLKKTARFKSNSSRDFRGARIFVQELLGMEMTRYTAAPAERLTDNSRPLFKTTLTAKSDFNLAFPRIDAYFEEGNQQPVRFELYDDQQKLSRRVNVLEAKNIQNYQTITKVEIEDLATNRKVNMETLKISYDRHLPDTIFTETSLQKMITDASRKLLQ